MAARGRRIGAKLHCNQGRWFGVEFGLCLWCAEVSMAMHVRFREFSEQCVSLAGEARTEGQKDTLLQMARAWRELAAEEERIEKLIQEADEAFGNDPEGFGARLKHGADFASRRSH
jgi:hypothetical protein